MPPLVDHPHFMTPPQGATNGGQPGLFGGPGTGNNLWAFTRFASFGCQFICYFQFIAMAEQEWNDPPFLAHLTRSTNKRLFMDIWLYALGSSPSRLPSLSCLGSDSCAVSGHKHTRRDMGRPITCSILGTTNTRCLFPVGITPPAAPTESTRGDVDHTEYDETSCIPTRRYSRYGIQCPFVGGRRKRKLHRIS